MLFSFLSLEYHHSHGLVSYNICCPVMLFSVLTRRFCGVVSKQITDTEQQTSGYVLYPPNKT